MPDALALFEKLGEKYKVEIVRDIAARGAKTLTLYKHGDWIDFCLGPHGPSTGRIGVVKLLNVAGAYWRGDSKNAMLQRIYGTAFFDRKALDAHLAKLEEVKKRDHRKLGPALGLFAFHDVAPGSAFWLPLGTTLYNVLADSMRRLVSRNGYQEVKTPLLFNKRLWEQSGHWGVYKENMFLVFDKEADPALPLEDRLNTSLKPMNCPSHYLIYNMGKRSYRELPVRYFTVDVLHRNELSGSLAGLTRVRQFAQDDSHIFLMESQIPDEVNRIVALMKTVYGAFGLEFALKLSTRPKPEERIGDDALWDKAEGALRAALEKIGMPWELNPGDGAFYGPKIDFVVTDSLGRKWQTCTIQLDYAAPERFDMKYVGDDNHEHRPVVIHRAIYGSFERFIAILTEHYAGRVPGVARAGAGADPHGLRPVRRLGARGPGAARGGGVPGGARPLDGQARREDPEHRARQDPVRDRHRREGGRGEGRRAPAPRRRRPQVDAARRVRRAHEAGSDAAVLARTARASFLAPRSGERVGREAAERARGGRLHVRGTALTLCPRHAVTTRRRAPGRAR